MEQVIEPKPPPKQTASRRVLRAFVIALRNLVRVLLIAWATLAVYYSNVPWPWLRALLAIAFASFAVWALCIAKRRRMRFAFAGAFIAVVIWFACIPPLNNRNWRPEVSVTPRVTRDGDRVSITGVRNFNFRAKDDFDISYETREFSLAHVASVDLFISYWKVGPIGHMFVSFNFDDATPPLAISIESRPEVGEKFSLLPSMFKQLELVYVVGDERDIIGSRATLRGEDVYRYRIQCSPADARKLLEVYLDQVNQLADRPQFYHLLSNSCTSNLVRYANAAGRKGDFDIRQLLNGWADSYLYAAGWVDTSVPFEELRRRARITDKAKAAMDAADFSQRIRASVPQSMAP